MTFTEFYNDYVKANKVVTGMIAIGIICILIATGMFMTQSSGNIMLILLIVGVAMIMGAIYSKKPKK